MKSVVPITVVAMGNLTVRISDLDIGNARLDVP